MIRMIRWIGGIGFSGIGRVCRICRARRTGESSETTGATAGMGEKRAEPDAVLLVLEREESREGDTVQPVGHDSVWLRRWNKKQKRSSLPEMSIDK